MLSRKGYSLVMWTVIFSLVIVALSFFQAPLRRTLQGKLMRTADHLIWGMWGNEPQDYEGEDYVYSTSDTKPIHPQVIIRHEKAGVIKTKTDSETEQESKTWYR